MRKKVLVVLADGFEEIEAITVIDVLRRAGLEVTIAGVGHLEIRSSHQVKIICDVKMEEYTDIPDLVVLPGGSPGAENLARSKELKGLIVKMHQSQKTIGAICAAPAVVLEPTGILKGRRATCYPGYEKRFGHDVSFVSDRVIRDGHIITSRGPGTSLEFALALARELQGDEVAESLAEKMLAKA